MFVFVMVNWWILEGMVLRKSHI